MKKVDCSKCNTYHCLDLLCIICIITVKYYCFTVKIILKFVYGVYSYLILLLVSDILPLLTVSIFLTFVVS